MRDNLRLIALTVFVALAMLGGVYYWGSKSVTVDVRSAPLLIVACPPPSIFMPADNTFGSTTISLTKTIGQYKTCRAAALGLTR